MTNTTQLTFDAWFGILGPATLQDLDDQLLGADIQGNRWVRWLTKLIIPPIKSPPTGLPYAYEQTSLTLTASKVLAITFLASPACYSPKWSHFLFEPSLTLYALGATLTLFALRAQ
ncbi:hypothetical protein FOYG_02074 [Fusarium oxysporum NRRL 32931]|uniref:Uncharacterized protein n=1 Tax=Fusarium oxysporum NRRL 32931 TaxID=660029 RepID=W9JDV5_FUSOX|nr:hypothetical protein FOYG_02074 [Fusarium oxysporum NRRL 32931]